MNEILVGLLVVTVLGTLCLGYPVAFTLGGVSVVFAVIASLFGLTDLTFIASITSRVYGIMVNDLLVSIPLFVFMGTMLERTKVAEELLSTMALLFGPVRSGLSISVMFVGALLAASTGIVGASVITMGLLSLPVMLRYRYSPAFACGSICAAGTLGQIIPPSLVLIILADQVSSAYQSAQMAIGNFAPKPVSILDLFAGALIPGLLLVAAYIIWQAIYGLIRPDAAPAMPIEERKEIQGAALAVRVVKVLIPPVLLIVAVLGSILFGIATVTEGAAVGALGALVLAALRRELTLARLRETMRSTTRISSMIFVILIGAAMFSLVFRGLGGDEIVSELLSSLPGGVTGAIAIVMLGIFLLGFVLDFMEIVFIVTPIVGPPIFAMGVDPIWFAILIAVNLQSSFLTPPFGFSLFYLRGVAPPSVRTVEIYRGVIPFVMLQMTLLILVYALPGLATWLPKQLYG